LRRRRGAEGARRLWRPKRELRLPLGRRARVRVRRRGRGRRKLRLWRVREVLWVKVTRTWLEGMAWWRSRTRSLMAMME
ncbi:hypothetical protein LTR16_007330, partial [Cryomyces antarcticus]